MRVQRIADIHISTVATDPLRGMVEITTVGTPLLLELDEHLAHRLCSDLERFLTRVPRRPRAKLQLTDQA